LNLPNVGGVVSASWAVNLKRRQRAKLLLFEYHCYKLLAVIFKKLSVEMSRWIFLFKMTLVAD